MAADLQKLDSRLRTGVMQVLQRCRARGCDMRPNYGLRDPFDQARLWRQSRSREEIQDRILKFRSEGAEFLAHCLESVGPQHGSHVTDAPPGFSWHQWGEALDCFWLVDDQAEWSTRRLVDGVNGYQVLAEEAERAGLTAGGHWARFKDWPHVQLRKTSNVAIVLTLREIDAAMRARFG